MQLSKSTVEVLNNLKDINPSIVITPGNNLVSFANDGGVLANAKIEDDFDAKFGIYDLQSFLTLVNLIDQPEIDTSKSSEYIVVSGSSSRYKFKVAPESLMRVPPKTEIDLPSEDIKFQLGEDALKRVLRAAAVFTLETVCFYSDGAEIYFGVSDPKQKGSDSFSVKLQDYTGDPFKVFVSISKLTLLPGNYDVIVCHSKKPFMVKFSGISRNIRYWAAADIESYIGDKGIK